MTLEVRYKAVKVYLYLLTVGLLFWWPLSHWFYPDLYHDLLGFKGGYPKDMVTVIGTCGVMVVCVAYFSAKNTVKNRDGILSVIIFSVVMGFTYIYLISKGAFPVREYLNVTLCFFTAGFLGFVYPWRAPLD